MTENWMNSLFIKVEVALGTLYIITPLKYSL